MAKKWFQKSDNHPSIITASGAITAAVILGVCALCVAAINGCFSKHQTTGSPATVNAKEISNSPFVVGNSNVLNIDNSQHNIDNSQKNYFGETNHPTFKLYLNSPDNEFTNGAFIKLSAAREIQVYIRNMSPYAVPDVNVEFIPDRVNETNLILDGWNKKGEVISTWHYTHTNMGEIEFHAPVYVFKCDLTPPNLRMRLPTISISKDVIPINAPTNAVNFYLPTLAGTFNVYAPGSPLQIWSCGFYVEGQDYPSEKELKQGYVDGK